MVSPPSTLQSLRHGGRMSFLEAAETPAYVIFQFFKLKNGALRVGGLRGLARKVFHVEWPEVDYFRGLNIWPEIDMQPEREVSARYSLSSGKIGSCELGIGWWKHSENIPIFKLKEKQRKNLPISGAFSLIILRNPPNTVWIHTTHPENLT